MIRLFLNIRLFMSHFVHDSDICNPNSLYLRLTLVRAHCNSGNGLGGMSE